MIRKRFRLLGVLSVAGALLFLPFAGDAQPGGLSLTQGVVFVLVSSAVSLLALWFGLRLADATGLRMPFLRAWEAGDRLPAPRLRPVVATVVGGLLLAWAAISTQRALGMPTPPSPAWARILSVVFAAVTLEVVLHLFGMSLLMKLTRRAWVAVLGSGLLLGLFHLTGAGALDRANLVIAGANTIAGVFVGWLYWAFGFEYLILGHAVMHIVTLLLT